MSGPPNPFLDAFAVREFLVLAEAPSHVLEAFERLLVGQTDAPARKPRLVVKEVAADAERQRELRREQTERYRRNLKLKFAAVGLGPPTTEATTEILPTPTTEATTEATTELPAPGVAPSPDPLPSVCSPEDSEANTRGKDPIGSHANGQNGSAAKSVVATTDTPKSPTTEFALAPTTKFVARETQAAQVKLVFEHWIASHGKDPSRTKLTDPRKQKVLARLREGYTVTDLCEAIDGCKLSSFHMGENDRGRPFNLLESILANGGRVEEHRDRLTSKPTDRANRVRGAAYEPMEPPP